MSGRVSWRLDELAIIAEFLGVSLTELVGGEAKASA